MRKPSHDPSIENEPHLRAMNPLPATPPNTLPPILPYADPRLAAPDAQSSVWQEPHLTAPARPAAEEDQVLHSVWEEPGIEGGVAGTPDANAPTYAKWLANRRGTVGSAKSWLIAIAIALAAGPWAIVGAIWGSGESAFGVLTLVLFAPVTEEIMKVALPGVMVEKRPYLFRSRLQIILCGVMSGLAFAAIENLLYLYVYIPRASPGLVVWRWTICVALHTTCSCISGIGVARIWNDTMSRQAMPRTSLGASWMTAAIVIHGAYNAFALILEKSGYEF